MNANTLPYWIIGGFGLLVFASLLHRKESIAWQLTLYVRSFVAYLAVVWVALQLFHTSGPAAFAFGLVAMLLVDRSTPSRSRRIPTETRRRVIARWERQTEKKYSSKSYEIDHIIPFSRGGDNSESNLEVIPKKRNRSKGAKSPWWDMLGR